MSTKTIADVRDHLFSLLDELADKEKAPDYERMRAACEVTQVMVNTVRLQVDYLKIIHGDGDLPFLDEPEPGTPNNNGSSGAAVALPNFFPVAPHARQRVHRLQG